MRVFVLLIMLVFGSENQVEPDANSSKQIGENSMENPILVKIEEDENVKVNERLYSNYTGVYYNERSDKWVAYRRSKNGKKMVYNGSYTDEETAAHASDTLARKFMEKGEQNHKLNFPDDDTEVLRKEKQKSSQFSGVSYSERYENWRAQRRSKSEKKIVFNGRFKDEETAAHASDTLARKLMANGEKGHKLNFPDNDTKVYAEKMKTSSNYIGVSYKRKNETWEVNRYSKNESKMIYNGFYKDEEIAAHASDTLARKLMAKGEQNLKLNFPDDDTEVHAEKKQPSSTFIAVYYSEKLKTWRAQRWSKKEKKLIYNGSYKDEETAARASDTLAKKLMANGEQNLKLNFPDENTEEYQREKRKRSDHDDF